MLRDKYPDYRMNPYCPSGSWQTSRYIQIFIDGYDDDLHYEYLIDGGWNGMNLILGVLLFFCLSSI